MTRYAQTYIAAHTADEVYHAAQAHDLTWGAVRLPEDNVADAQFRARGGFAEIEHDGIGALPYTTAPWIADKAPWHIEHRAPRLGEHNAEVYGALGIDGQTLARLRAAEVL